MNAAQELWLRQARSDDEVFVHLRRSGTAHCHLLHYLQMATEKLSKAYLWRSGNPPPRTHTGFVRFLRALVDRRFELSRIATVLGFRRRADLDNLVRDLGTLAYSLQNLAPAEAQNGPNPEYPWPHEAPVHCPVDHAFVIWNELANTGRGRRLMQFIERAIVNFERYG